MLLELLTHRSYSSGSLDFFLLANRAFKLNISYLVIYDILEFQSWFLDSLPKEIGMYIS